MDCCTCSHVPEYQSVPLTCLTCTLALYTSCVQYLDAAVVTWLTISFETNTLLWTRYHRLSLECNLLIPVAELYPRMEVLGWILVSLLLCLVLAVLTFLRQSQAVGGEERRRPQEVARGPGGRRQAGRMRRQVDREDSDQEEERDEDREELEEAGIKVPEGKIGKKKMEKLQAKADKKLQREAEQKEREENKKKREKLEEEERQKREMEKEEERRQEEEERKLREEKERREQEEYEKLKAAFSVEDEGCDAEDEEDEENRLLKFINYIKETKVSYLTDSTSH